MFNKKIILINISILIALVNGHGYLLDPVSRALYQNMQKDNQTCCPQEEMSGGLIYKNYYRS
jgi:hypothetical protein